MGLDLTKGGLKPTSTPSTRPSHRSPPLSHERTTASPTFPAPAPFPTPVSQPQQQYKAHKGAQHGLALPQKRPLGPRDVALDLDAGGSKKLRKKMRKVMDEADAVAHARDSASEAGDEDDDDDDEMPPPKQPRKNGSVPIVAATATNGTDKGKAIKGEGGDSAFTQQHDYIPLADTRHSSSPPAPAFDDLAPSQSDAPRPSQPGDVNTSAPSSDMDIVTVGGEEHQTGGQSFIGSPLSIATDVETVSYFVEEREYLVLDDDDDADLAELDAASAADSGAGSAWDSKTAIESLIDEEFDGEPMQASQEAEEGGATHWRDDGDLVAQAKAAWSRVEKRFAEEQLEELDNAVNKRRKLVPIDEEDDYLFTPQRSRSLAAHDSSASLGPARTNGARSQYGDELAASQVGEDDAHAQVVEYSQVGEDDAHAQVVESHAGKPALPPTVSEWYEGAARPFMRWAERLAAEQQEKEEKREADEQHESGQALEGEVANEKDLGEYVKAFDSLKAKVEQLVDRKTTRHASHAAVLSAHGRTLQEKQALLDGSITNLINWSRPFFSSTKRLLNGGSMSKEEQGEQGNEQEEKEQVEED